MFSNSSKINIELHIDNSKLLFVYSLVSKNSFIKTNKTVFKPLPELEIGIFPFSFTNKISHIELEVSVVSISWHIILVKLFSGFIISFSASKISPSTISFGRLATFRYCLNKLVAPAPSSDTVFLPFCTSGIRFLSADNFIIFSLFNLFDLNLFAKSVNASIVLFLFSSSKVILDISDNTI